MNRSTNILRDLVRAAGRHRRLFASLAAAATVYFTLTALSPDPPGMTSVLAAAHDLPGGSPVTSGDLVSADLPKQAVPTGTFRAGAPLAGRILAGPVRAGEPLTDARFVAPGLVRRLPGDAVVAYPVRIDDSEVVALLRTGDHVDLVAAGSTSSITVARSAPVIALPSPADAARGALLVLAVPRATATAIAQESVNNRLTIAITGDSG
jgi:Flp pilus assembly protein CpaB